VTRQGQAVLGVRWPIVASLYRIHASCPVRHVWIVTIALFQNGSAVRRIQSGVLEHGDLKDRGELFRRWDD
jgi:hypothetical protein